MNPRFVPFVGVFALLSFVACSAACGPSLSDARGCVVRYSEERSRSEVHFSCEEGRIAQDFGLEVLLGGTPYEVVQYDKSALQVVLGQSESPQYYELYDIEELERELVISDGTHQIVFAPDARSEFSYFTICESDDDERQYRSLDFGGETPAPEFDMRARCQYIEPIE